MLKSFAATCLALATPVGGAVGAARSVAPAGSAGPVGGPVGPFCPFFPFLEVGVTDRGKSSRRLVVLFGFDLGDLDFDLGLVIPVTNGSSSENCVGGRDFRLLLKVTNVLDAARSSM